MTDGFADQLFCSRSGPCISALSIDRHASWCVQLARPPLVRVAPKPAPCICGEERGLRVVNRMGKRPKERWIVVCDASRARVFKEHDQTRRYELVQEVEHPESRAHVRELVSDATGRKPVGVPLGGSYGGRSVSRGHGRIGAAPSSNPKEVEATKFARELGRLLEHGFYEHAYEVLVLVAPPPFLALLFGGAFRLIRSRPRSEIRPRHGARQDREPGRRMGARVDPSRGHDPHGLGPSC